MTPGATGPAPSPEVVPEQPCSNPGHHRGHRWVMLPGSWVECPGIKAYDLLFPSTKD